MNDAIPAGSGQLDPETAAKLALLIDQMHQVLTWGCGQDGERLRYYALCQGLLTLERMKDVAGIVG